MGEVVGDCGRLNPARGYLSRFDDVTTEQEQQARTDELDAVIERQNGIAARIGTTTDLHPAPANTV